LYIKLNCREENRYFAFFVADLPISTSNNRMQKRNFLRTHPTMALLMSSINKTICLLPPIS